MEKLQFLSIDIIRIITTLIQIKLILSLVQLTDRIEIRRL